MEYLGGNFEAWATEILPVFMRDGAKNEILNLFEKPENDVSLVLIVFWHSLISRTKNASGKES